MNRAAAGPCWSTELRFSNNGLPNTSFHSSAAAANRFEEGFFDRIDRIGRICRISEEGGFRIGYSRIGQEQATVQSCASRPIYRGQPRLLVDRIAIFQ